MRFSSKRVLVTGAGAGIGRAAAEAFAAEGATVFATDANPVSLDSFRGHPDGIIPEVLDVTDTLAVKASAARLGPVDVIFNCAGVVLSGSILATTRSDWDRAFQVNVTAMFEVTQAWLPAMVDRRAGVILNMASVVSSVKGMPNRFAYGASKAAVIGLTKSIAADFVTQGIRCNAICPGTVDTPSLKERMLASEDYEAARLAFIGRQPVGRLATPEEIAALVLYLGSDAAAYITGQAIVIDGGISI